jgi:hypothetical protein
MPWMRRPVHGPGCYWAGHTFACLALAHRTHGAASGPDIVLDGVAKFPIRLLE